MSRAKEGSRTPTRVTPLEPESTAPRGFRDKRRAVRSDRYVRVGRQKTAGFRRADQNSRACTGIGSTLRITTDFERDYASDRPAWLDEASAHIRAHYPDDGVSLSCLYGLLGAGFEMAVWGGE